MADTGARVTVAVDSAETVSGRGRSTASARCSSTWTWDFPAAGARPTTPAASPTSPARADSPCAGSWATRVTSSATRTGRGASEQTAEAWRSSPGAHDDVGGAIVSAGGTGTYDLNVWCTEIQAGSYALMDTAYAQHGLPFGQALWIEATIISVSTKGWFVADAGLKSLGMDHGNPSVDGAEVLFCSDEHITVRPETASPAVGDRIRVWPAHVDPTIALHERMYVTDGDDVVETWEVDLRGW